MLHTETITQLLAILKASTIKTRKFDRLRKNDGINNNNKNKTLFV